ncbi:translation initiation factor eIF-2 beta subunit [Coemansia sp. RSA 1722]|nr:translation initiation factor eIF-2 beta subunit [Coemansia sp. RSA 485]KAJ2606870.1 translation initiation factor eIF-2 beta subunit [Coemansia sp. RSA 1722]
MGESDLENQMKKVTIDTSQDQETFDLSSMKKKKQKQKIKLEDLTGDDEGSSAPKDEEDAFAELKKKKKKSKTKTVSFDEEDGAAEGADGDDAEVDISLMKKKKKSKKKSMAAFEAELDGEEAPATATSSEKATGPWVGTDRDYTYQELLGRFYSVLHNTNPGSAGTKGKYVMVPPHITRDGTKRTAFTNVEDIAKKMHRTPDHLIKYIYSELATTGSMDAKKNLIIKGRFQQKQIENVLRRYIVEYVTCKTCKSGDTRLSKENSLYFVKCESCGSSRSVMGISKGYQAVQGGKRRAERLAAPS